MSHMGHSRRFGFVRFRRHCGPEFLRQRRDGEKATSRRRAKKATLNIRKLIWVVILFLGLAAIAFALID